MLTNTIIYLKKIKTLIYLKTIKTLSIKTIKTLSTKTILHNQYNFLSLKKQLVLNKPNSLLN